PLGMARGHAAQAVPGFFLRVYAGAGLVSQRLARGQLTSKRRQAVRIASRLTRWGVTPWAKLTSAASSKGHRLVGWPKVRGLWCRKAWSRFAPSAPTRSRVVWGREEPRWRHASPRRLNACPTLRTVCSLQSTWRALRGTPAPYSLASTIWQRRTVQTSADRRPLSSCWRSAGVRNRTNPEGCRIPHKIPHFPKIYPAQALGR